MDRSRNGRARERTNSREDWITTLEAIERGDRVALVKLTNLITGFLYRYRAYHIRDHWDDVCQEVLVALIRAGRRGAIREPRAFVSYVGRITRNKLIDRVECQKKPGQPDPQADLSEQLLELEAPEEDVDLLTDLRRAVDRLPEKTRRVVDAIYLQGRTYGEASKLLGLPLGSLKHLQSAGLRELRARMRMDLRREGGHHRLRLPSSGHPRSPERPAIRFL